MIYRLGSYCGIPGLKAIPTLAGLTVQHHPIQAGLIDKGLVLILLSGIRSGLIEKLSIMANLLRHLLEL